MPEIKHNFSAGKMNKDRDERLVQNGEYRDAMNIQVRTTDGSEDGVGDAGTVQNIKGNVLRGSAYYAQGYTSVQGVVTETSVVASIADEKNNSAYFFMASANIDKAWDLKSPDQVTEQKLYIDTIIEVKETTGGISSNPIVVDVHGISDTYNNVFVSASGNIDYGPNGTGVFASPYNEIKVIDSSKYRVGMTMYAYEDGGLQVFTNAEIQSIDTTASPDYDVITLNTQQTANLQNSLAIVFKAPPVLNFSELKKRNKKITGINIIDNLLFWTDSYTEPKKINIDRCRAGTNSFTNHTKLMINNQIDSDAVNEFDNLEYVLSPVVNNHLKEEHITVMRKAPLTAPNLEMSRNDRTGEVDANNVGFTFTELTENDGVTTITEPAIGDVVVVSSQEFNGNEYRVNDILIFKESSAETGGNQIKCTINTISVGEDGNTSLDLTILAVLGKAEGISNWDIELEAGKPLFELKLCRFGYRYIYTDGEYSSFSPWSELAFLPGNFDYNHKKGFNLGMVNTVRNLVIKDFIPHVRTRPFDVIGVDILYKTTDSPNIYIVKTIKREKDPEWELFTPGNGGNTGVNSMTFGRFNLTSEMIHRTLPSNQTLRAWDNVPRYALAQEITANRVIYGNYVQGYDINYPVKLNQNHLVNSPYGNDQDDDEYSSVPSVTDPKKSIKTIRDYKFGMVFGDKYGRETPVISPGNIVGDSPETYSPTTGDTRIPKQFANDRNSFELIQNWNSPGTNPGVPLYWMDYVKYYVKETSNEYYNLIMDRWYTAEDGNVWLSFQSADRNKVDEETYLILKNEHGTNVPVQSKARYKIISISGDAPDFIKIDERKMGRITLSNQELGQALNDQLDPDPTSTSPAGLMANSEIVIGANQWDKFLKQYKMKGNLMIRLVGKTGSGEKYTKWKNITHHTGGDEEGEDAKLVWSEPFGSDADLLLAFQSEGISTSDLTYHLEIKEDVVSNKPEFDGKFFVKIEKDLTLDQTILKYTDVEGEYIPSTDYPLTYIDSQKNHPSFGVDCDFCNATNMPYRNYIWGTEDTPENNGAQETGTGGQENNTLGTNVAAIPNGLTSTTAKFMGIGNVGNNFSPNDQNLSNFEAQFADETRAYWEWVREYEGSSSHKLKVRMFIDAARGRAIPLEGTDNMEYFKPTGLDIGVLDGDGFGPTETDLGRMTVSINYWGWGGDEQGFRNKMETKGTIFAFKGDPNNNRYKVVSTIDQTDSFENGVNFSDGVNIGVLGGGGANVPVEIDINEDENFATFADDDYTQDTLSFIKATWNGATISGAQVTGMLSSINDQDNYRSGFRFEFRRIDPETTVDLIDNGTKGIDTSVWDPRGLVPHDGRMRLSIITYERKFVGGDVYVPSANASVWETEPKENVGLDIYYEASNSIPMRLNSENTPFFAPYNSRVTVKQGSTTDGFTSVTLNDTYDHKVWTIGYTANTSVIGIRSKLTSSDAVQLHKTDISIGDLLVFEHENGTKTMSRVTNFMGPNIEHNDDANLIETVFSPTALGSNTTGLTITYAGYNLSDGSAVIQITNGNGANLEIGQMISDENATALIPNNIFITSVFGNNFYITVNDSSWLDITSPYTSYKAGALAATGYYEIDTEVWKYPVELPWFNCYSFGNGVESDRIRDDFNAPTIDNGVVVSTTLNDYGKETKGSGMIYSGLYNSTSGVNDLNEFNMADKITKDLNPVYGSIQALKTRDTDVVVLTEDKILKVTTNKDALFNADGNPQLIASNRVLGTAVPFIGDYGISKNPESLVKDQYRMYFTDMQRGAVMRLSRDGLTPISNVGMKTWFRNNLKKADLLLGTFDSVNGEYNLTLDYPPNVIRDVYSEGIPDTTVSFNEASKGWVSFKSFIPQGGTSVGGKYITAIKSDIYEHHVDQEDLNGTINNRNTFYNEFTSSYVSVLFNDLPSQIKSFKSINYEGSQSYVKDFISESIVDAAGNTLSLTDGNYYNLSSKNGWYVDKFTTDIQAGSVPEFIQKENKWFNNIHGDNIVSFSSDTSEFTVQGIGTLSSVSYSQGDLFEITVEADMINDTTD